MKMFFKKYGILFAGIALALFVFPNTSPLFLSAKIDMPFSSGDAGVFFQPKENLATEAGHDSGVEQIGAVTSTIFLFLKSTLGLIAVGWMVWTGVMMVGSGTNEDQITKGRHMATYIVLGLLTMILVEPMIMDILYGGRGVEFEKTGILDIEDAYSNFSAETRAVISWLEAILVFVAMGFLVFAGFRMVFAFGEEEEISSGKNMIIPIFFGLLLLALNEVIIDEIIYRSTYDGQKVIFDVGEENANALMGELVGMLQYFLFFVAIIAFALLVYGGFLYVLSFGEEEKSESGKKTFINAAIGLLVILISFALTYSLMGLQI